MVCSSYPAAQAKDGHYFESPVIKVPDVWDRNLAFRACWRYMGGM